MYFIYMIQRKWRLLSIDPFSMLTVHRSAVLADGITGIK